MKGNIFSLQERYTNVKAKLCSGGRAMIISVRKLVRFCKYSIVFIMLAYFLYKLLGVIDIYLLPVDKYRVPDGSAVKVFHIEQDGVSGVDKMTERLKLFFWYGE